MKRFKTLPTVLFSEGSVFQLAEELAIVIGLAAEKIKGNLEKKEPVRRSNIQRLTLISSVLLIGLAIFTGWWLQRSGLSDFLPGLIGGVMLALLAVALSFLFAPRRKDKESDPTIENAAITYAGLFYWPIGILPLSEERSVLWDPLNSPDAPLKVMQLNADWGLKHQEVVQSAADKIRAADEMPIADEMPVADEMRAADEMLVAGQMAVADEIRAADEMPITDEMEMRAADEMQMANEMRMQATFTALLSFSEGLTQLNPQAVTWPGNAPDQSTQELAQEVPDMWRQLIALPADKLPAAIHTLFRQDELLADWEELSAQAADVHHFYSGIESLRAQVKRYHERAEKLVDATRDVLLQHGWQTTATVQESRDAYFVKVADKPVHSDAISAEQPLPTAPTESLLMSSAESGEQIRQALDGLQAALTPLDEAMADEHKQINAQEAEQLQAVEQKFIEHRQELDDDKRQLDVMDSDILTLADTLDIQQNKIHDYASLIQQGFANLANVPLEQLQAQLQELHEAIQDANALISDVSQKIELDAVEETLAELIQATDKAQAEWQALAQQMPESSHEVSGRVDKTITALTALTDKPEMEEDGLKKIEASVKAVERVARTMVSWSAAQQNPIDAVVDTFSEFEGHLAALREQRQKLEQSSETLITLNDADSEREVTLPDTIEQLEVAFTRFIQLSEETNNAMLAMDNAAKTVSKQAQGIETLLEERDSLYAAYQEKLSTFQQAEKEEREQIRHDWQQKRKALEEQREQLNDIQKKTEQRLNDARSEPDISTSGVMVDNQSASWSDKVVNLMSGAVEQWGQRIAGVDGSVNGHETEIKRISQALERCYEDIHARSVPSSLSEAHHALEPQLCFVPFWYIETKIEPTGVLEKESGRRIHIFPPLNIKRSLITEVPQLENVRYEELTRRILTYLRRDFSDEQELLSSLSFEPEQLTNAGKLLDLEAAAMPLHELANAVAQHWVIFRSSDTTLNRIVKNTRDHLVPEAQIHEALWQQKHVQDKKLGLPPSHLNGTDKLHYNRPQVVTTQAPKASAQASTQASAQASAQASVQRLVDPLAHSDMRPSELFHLLAMSDTGPIELPPMDELEQ